MSLNDLIQIGVEKQKAHKAAAAAEKAAKAELEEIKFQIQEACEKAGVDSASIKGFANITVGTKEMPTVKDWDAVAGFIKKHDALHLFQKRIMQGAFEEYRNQGIEVPGIDVFEKTTVTIRDLS